MMELYKEKFCQSNYEQLDLYEYIATEYDIYSALYPGSFVQISPSFYFPYVCYVDSNRKAKSVFKHIYDVADFIRMQTNYEDDVKIKFYYQNYDKPIKEPKSSFDLLISQYTRLSCQACKQYLRKGGFLLADNSLGNAGMAAIDEDFRLLGVFDRCGKRYTFSDDHLEDYFIPKKDYGNIKEFILNTGRGIPYTKTATHYLFSKTR